MGGSGVLKPNSWLEAPQALLCCLPWLWLLPSEA